MSHISYINVRFTSIQLNFDRYQSSIISEVSVLLRCDTAPQGILYPTFGDRVVILSSRVYLIFSTMFVLYKIAREEDIDWMKI
jgi:hypothetical protein